MYTFSLLLGMGAVLGMLWPTRRLLRMHRPIKAGLLGLAGAVLGGRLAYVAVNWLYYQAHPAQIIQLPMGGLSWPGAFAGGLLALAVYALASPFKWFVLLDTFFPAFAALTIAAWLGCWSDGCAYGAPSTAWYALPASDEWGNITSRIPLQLAGSLLALLTLWIFENLRGVTLWRRRAAHLGFLTLAAQLWGLSYLKTDPAPMLYSTRLETWGALTFTLVFTLLTLYTFLTPAHPEKPGA